MNPNGNWFERLFATDHRNAVRRPGAGLVAYYWEGTNSHPHEVRNISTTGFYLATRERWHPGTIITMTLQKSAVAGKKPELYIAVQTKVVRLGEDGVGFTFLNLEPHDPTQKEALAAGPVGKKALDRFLDQVLSDRGHILIGTTRAVPHQATSGGNAMQLIRKSKHEDGQALIITVLCMTCLLGFTALATDVGVMLREKRLVQTAADAAAIAGAIEYNYSSSSITSAAKGASSQNGFTDGSNGTTVTINHPPLSGPHAGLANYVEALVTKKQPTIFMNLFGFGSMNVGARAVAENGGASFNCVIVLSQSAPGAMSLQGSFNVNTPNCGVQVNSTASNALCVTGGGGSMTAGSIGVTGGDSGGNCNSANQDLTPDPVTGQVMVSDPIATQPGFQFPDPTKLSCTAPTGGVLTGTIAAPAGGTACYSGNVTLNNATLGTGVFVFTGNVTVSGTFTTASKSAGGTLLDMNTGSFTVNTGTTLNMTGIQGGMYDGIAIMMPTGNKNTITIQFGNSTGSLLGIIYAPDGNLFLHDSGGDKNGGISLTTDLIVGTLNDQTATLNIQSYSQSNGGPLTKVNLVE